MQFCIFMLSHLFFDVVFSQHLSQSRWHISELQGGLIEFLPPPLHSIVVGGENFIEAPCIKINY